jgi:uncharacterized protein (TIGR03084 family)
MALVEQHIELAAILVELDELAWGRSVPRCPGWTVSDVVLHLAQTDEMATASATGKRAELYSVIRSQGTVDDGAAVAVAQQRGPPPTEVFARWRVASSTQYDALARADPRERLPWVTNTLTPATLATTRLAEAWIHTGDIAEALGISTRVASGLRHIAWLAWRTLPYAFGRDGRTLSGPVAASLTAPDGSVWRFGDFTAAATTVTGLAEDWCLVAARRLDSASARLRAEGPDAATVLSLVRTYA